MELNEDMLRNLSERSRQEYLELESHFDREEQLAAIREGSGTWTSDDNLSTWLLAGVALGCAVAGIAMGWI